MSDCGFHYCLHAGDLYGEDSIYKLDESAIVSHEPADVLNQLYEGFLQDDGFEDYQYVTIKHKEHGWLIVLEDVDGNEKFDMPMKEVEASLDDPDEVLLELMRRYYDEKVDIYYSVQRKVKKVKV